MLLALRWLIDGQLKAGASEAAIDLAHGILKIEPHSEQAYCVLIESLAQLGHLSQVKRWYELMTTTLKTVLGAEPSEATIRLYEKSQSQTGPVTRSR